MKYMKTIYVAEEDIPLLNDLIEQELVHNIPSFDQDKDWDKVPEEHVLGLRDDAIDGDSEDEDDRCDWCVEHNVDNCRHVGM